MEEFWNGIATRTIHEHIDAAGGVYLGGSGECPGTFDGRYVGGDEDCSAATDALCDCAASGQAPLLLAPVYNHQPYISL
jgi:hypothetical protein